MPLRAADYSFDAAELEPRAYEIGGFVEGRYEHFWLRRDAALFPLSFPTPPSGDALDRGTVGYEIGGKYRKDMLGLYALVSGGAAYDQTDSTSEFQWLEGGLRLSPSEGLTFRRSASRCSAGARATRGTRWASSSGPRIRTTRSCRAKAS